jgi:hypothetical protein
MREAYLAVWVSCFSFLFGIWYCRKNHPAPPKIGGAE